VQDQPKTNSQEVQDQQKINEGQEVQDQPKPRRIKKRNLNAAPISTVGDYVSLKTENPERLQAVSLPPFWDRLIFG